MFFVDNFLQKGFNLRFSSLINLQLSINTHIRFFVISIKSTIYLGYEYYFFKRSISHISDVSVIFLSCFKIEMR